MPLTPYEITVNGQVQQIVLNSDDYASTGAVLGITAVTQAGSTAPSTKENFLIQSGLAVKIRCGCAPSPTARITKYRNLICSVNNLSTALVALKGKTIKFGSGTLTIKTTGFKRRRRLG